MRSKIISKVTIWEDFSQNIGKSILHTRTKLFGITIDKYTDVSVSYSTDSEAKKKRAGFIAEK